MSRRRSRSRAGAGRPARARLHVARRPGAVPLPEVTLRLMAEAPSLRARGRAAALRRERARRRTPPAELVDEIFALPAGATRPTRPAGRRRPPPARTFAGVDARDRGADARPRRHRRQRRRPSQRGAARRAYPRRARRAVRRRRAPVLLGAPERVRQDRRRSSSDERAHDRPDHPRPRADDAATGSRSTRAAATWTYAELDARSDELARWLVAWRSCLDADRQLGRARRAHVRVREGGCDPASDLVAARSRGGRVPAGRRRAGASSSSRTSYRELGEAALELAQRAARRSSRRVTARYKRARFGRRPAPPDLHLGNDREAEGRAAHARELLLDQPLLRPRDRASGPTTSCCRCCRSSTAAAGTCSRSSPGGRARRVVLERGFDASRALELIETRRITTMMGVPANYLFMAQEPGFAAADLALAAARRRRWCADARAAARHLGRARRRDRAGVRADRGRAERPLPAPEDARRKAG